MSDFRQSDLFKRGFKLSLPDLHGRESLLKRLAALGLVRVDEEQYVKCFNPEDRDRRCASPFCDGMILIERARDETEAPYQCPACQRDVDPREKHKYGMLRIWTVQDTICRCVESLLADLGCGVSEEPVGLLRVNGPAAEVRVVVLDYCSDDAVLEDLLGNTVNTIYIVCDERAFAAHVPPGAMQFGMADIVFGDGARRLKVEVVRMAGVSATQAPVPAVLRHRPRKPRGGQQKPVANPFAGVKRLPALPGAEWKDVVIYLVDGHDFRFVVPGHAPQTLSCAQLGMVETGAKEPTRTKQFHILHGLCEGEGYCHWEVSECRSFGAFKVQLTGLTDRLQYITGIPDRPFLPVSQDPGVLYSVFKAFKKLPDKKEERLERQLRFRIAQHRRKS